MVEVDASTPVVGPGGDIPLIDTFDGRSQLFASYHMWHTGHPAAEQCEGCTFFSGQVLELSYLHSRDVTYAVFCQGPFLESNRYRVFMGWDMPWYCVPEGSLDRLVAGRHFGMKVCYLRIDDRVYETYWTTSRGVEPNDEQLRNARHDGLRTSRDVGGLARRLASAFFDRRRPVPDQ
jgi:hypothetical protein